MLNTYNADFVFPSITTDLDERLLNDNRGKSLLELRDGSALSHPKQFAVSALQLADESTIDAVRERVREIADNCGFPEEMNLKTQQDFDRQLGTELLQLVNVASVFAAKREMWTFLSCVVLPELAPWRYAPDAVHKDRVLGGDRDLLRSRWWRAWALGPDLTFAPKNRTPLREDEFTSIMERPAIGYTPRLAAAVRDCIWRHESHVGNRRMTFTRGLTRRIVSERTFRALDLLDDKDLNEVLDGMAREVRRSISEADK